MDAKVDLTLLSMFVEVAEAASFTKAAQRLGTTPSTISRSVAKLEQSLGAELLRRTTRSVSLSTAGAALYERTAPHLRALRRAASELPERQEDPAGLLRITAPYDLGATLLGELVARFVARYPKVRVDADMANRTRDLVGEGYDLALRGDTWLRRDSSLTMRRIVSRAWLRFYASPSYVARRGQPRVVGSPDHEWLIAGPLARLAGLPRDLEPRISANDFLFLRAAACAGAGVAMLPAFMAGPQIAAGELIRVLESVRVDVGGLALVYPSSRTPSRKVTAFRDFLVAMLKKDWFE